MRFYQSRILPYLVNWAMRNREFEPYLWAQMKYFDPTGKLLSNWPAFPLNCNPKFVKGDFDGVHVRTGQ